MIANFYGYVTVYDSYKHHSKYPFDNYRIDALRRGCPGMRIIRGTAEPRNSAVRESDLAVSVIRPNPSFSNTAGVKLVKIG